MLITFNAKKYCFEIRETGKVLRYLDASACGVPLLPLKNEINTRTRMLAQEMCVTKEHYNNARNIYNRLIYHEKDVSS